MTDEQLIVQVQQEKCEDSLKELIQRHSPLFYRIYKKYESSLISSGSDITVVLKEKDYIIYQSALSYTPGKSKFSTWLSNQVRWDCLNRMKRQNKYVLVESEDLEFLSNSKSYNGDYKSLSNKDNLDYIISILNQIDDERIKTIYNMRYFESNKKVAWSKIAAKLGISLQTTINLHNKGRKLLLEKLTSKNNFDKI